MPTRRTRQRTPHYDHRRRVVKLGGGSLFPIYDEFSQDIAAGSLNATASDPGGGQRYVTDPGNDIVIAEHILRLTSPGAWDTSYIHWLLNSGVGITRAADTVIEFDLVAVESTKQVMVGWYNALPPAVADTEHVFYLGAGADPYARNAAANTDVGTYEFEVRYRVRLVLQATGCKFYISGGTFGIFDKQYTLAHTDNAENTATLYPAAMSFNGIFDIDNLTVELTDDTSTADIDNDLEAALAAWQGNAARIHTAGTNEADWVATANVNGVGGGGRTYICPTNAIMQDGYLRQIKVNVHARDGTAWGIKIFRWDYVGGVNYDYIAGEAFTPDATGTYTHTLVAPIAVQPGDIMGLFLPDANNAVKVSDPYSRNIVMKVAVGDIVAANAFGVDHGDANQFEIDGLTNRPYFATVGDSILAGHNTASHWKSWYDNHTEPTSWLSSPGGAGTEDDPADMVRAKVGAAGNTLQYQNYCIGSQGWQWCSTDGVPSALATQPNALVILAGVNDVISFGSTWAQVEGWMDTIKTLFDASVADKLYICEILPATSASDAQAATIRQWNVYIAAWCVANDATLISTWEAVGQYRATTAVSDDLYSLFDFDNVHLTHGGVDTLADRIAYALMQGE